MGLRVLGKDGAWMNEMDDAAEDEGVSLGEWEYMAGDSMRFRA